jgi:hypothetical protein
MLTLKLRAILVAITICAVAIIPQVAIAHCQVPCGIYDDDARFTLLAEHITTIEKAMNQINSLVEDGLGNGNQSVRWVVNKEEHAQAFAEILSYYFLAQRIKAPDDDSLRDAYLKNLELIHRLTVVSMKCKQATDLALVEQMRGILDEFRVAYQGH